MLNHIVLMGRLTRDPELRRTQSGLSVAAFTLAIDRDFADKGTGQRETDFIDIVAWRSTADFVAKYFTKGRMAVVEGRLKLREWQDRDGNKRRSAEVVASSVYFGDSKKDSSSGSNNRPQNRCQQYGSQQPASPAYQNRGCAQQSMYTDPPQYTELEDDDGDLPF